MMFTSLWRPWFCSVGWYLAEEIEVNVALWAMWLGKDFTFT